MAQYGQELYLDMHSENAHPIMRMTASGVYSVDVHITENGIDAFDDYVSLITTGLNGNTYIAIRWAENSVGRFMLSEEGIDRENKCLSFAVKAPDKVSGRAVGYLAIDSMRSQLFFVDVESANISYDTPAETNVKYQELTKAQYDALATKDPDTLYRVNRAGKYIYYIGDSILASEYGLITKSITQNGTYNAANDNADGYSSVTVDVGGGADYISDGKVLDIDCKGMRLGINLKGDGSLNAYQFKTIETCFKWAAAQEQIGRIVELTPIAGNVGLCLAINTNYPDSNLEVKVSNRWVFEDGNSGINIPSTEVHTLSMVTDTGSSSPSQGTKIYLDGVLVKTSGIVISASEASYGFDALQLLGVGSSNRQLIGTIYNFRSYNRLLSAAEVAQNYAVDQSRYGT